MQQLTRIIPRAATLPPELALLRAPVIPTQPNRLPEPIGESAGVVVDDASGEIVGVLVMIDPRFAGADRRTLIPASSVRVENGELHVDASQEQILVQPRLDETWQLPAKDAGTAPEPSDGPSDVAPKSGVDRQELVTETVTGATVGAAIGAIAGAIALGPIGAAVFAAFFGAGGSFVGFIGGGATGEGGKPAPAVKGNRSRGVDPALTRLGDALRRELRAA